MSDTTTDPEHDDPFEDDQELDDTWLGHYDPEPEHADRACDWDESTYWGRSA